MTGKARISAGPIAPSQFAPPNAGYGGYVLTDTSYAPHTTTSNYSVSTSYNGWWNNHASGNGFSWQFGSGITAAARSDYKIQTALGTKFVKEPYWKKLVKRSERITMKGYYVTVRRYFDSDSKDTLFETLSR
jgi:hypothetical protein